MASLRVHGQGRDRYDNERIGLNARMDTLQAAVLLPKLAVFAQELKARGEAAKRYQEGLSGLAPDLVLPKVPYGMESAWAQYSVLARNPGERARITAGLEESGVPTAIYYPRPLHLQKAFAHLGGAPGDFPVAEEMSGRIFSLPMHPYLEKHDQDRVIEALAGLVPA
jgi:dTDP-4-amino-4,6-dideoxygalactose transaminase